MKKKKKKDKKMRKFEDTEAKRTKVPLLCGIVGPSGSGKTLSALRLATGMQQVVGGDIFVIDTESKRSLHYADQFKFRHLNFGAPFSPLDYLAAIEHCWNKGGRVIVIDSFSHEHEGPGGVLEWHAAEAERLAKAWGTSVEKTNMTAWAKPKAARRRLINTVLQMDINAIFCFRAKDKLEIIPGKQPRKRGLMPIGGEEFVYEMTQKFLLRQGSDGFPTTREEAETREEREIVKVPQPFRELFGDKHQLCEGDGATMATWALGENVDSDLGAEVRGLVERYGRCSTVDDLADLDAERKVLWKRVDKIQKLQLKEAADKTVARLSGEDEEEEPMEGAA